MGRRHPTTESERDACRRWPITPWRPVFERYTEAARRVLFFARYEASNLHCMSIETEHLLLGLLHEPKGLASRVLNDAQVTYDRVRGQIQMREGERTPESLEIPFTEETKRVLHCALEESKRLQHSYIGSEHLLLGLLREEHSVAGSILTAHGMRIESVREQILKILSEPPDSSDDRVEDIEQIRQLVEALARAPAASPEAREIIERIHRALDNLMQ